MVQAIAKKFGKMTPGSRAYSEPIDYENLNFSKFRMADGRYLELLKIV